MAGTRLTLLLPGAILMLAVVVAGCAPEPDAEQALREWVDRGEAAANREDRRELVSMISPAYADARGNDREEIDRVLRLMFLQQEDVTVVAHIEEINVYGDTAADMMLTTAMAGFNDSRFGFSADAIRFQFELEHDGSDWQLTSARWGELGEDLD